MMIKSRTKEEHDIVWKIDYVKCPYCGFEFHLSCLKPYYGSGYTPADRPHCCPGCGFPTTFSHWYQLRGRLD